ncbi:type II secretion system protein GspM [Maricaulis sp.]|uniref:type II secretion system protein GspM n=1 Tax=Maricaulis sp. TaxID=1486257 RepID=UPI003A9255DE
MTGFINMLTGLWSARSGREQAMLAGLAILVLGWAGYSLVVNPVLHFHEAARQDFAAAVERHREIRDDLEAYTALPASAPGDSEAARPLRTIVGLTATTRRIAIAGIVPAADGRLSVHVDRADYGAAMSWLIDLERRYGVEVMSATMARQDGGQIELNLVLARQGG